MTFRQLQYFLTAAQCLSITMAAKKLYLSQSALSRQIQSLEDELGNRLFVRNKQTLTLTPSGSVLYQKLPDLMKQVNAVLTEAKDAATVYEGVLRIGILDDHDMSEILRPLLSQLERRLPNIEITLTRLPLSDLFRAISDGTLDIVYTYDFSLEGTTDFVSVEAQKVDLCVMLHRQHPLTGKIALTLEDICEERLVQLSSDFKEDGQQCILGAIPMGKRHPDVIIVDKIDDLSLWVEVGKAIAVVGSCTTMRHNPQIAIRNLVVPEVNGLTVSATWRKNSRNPAVAVFSELMQAVDMSESF